MYRPWRGHRDLRIFFLLFISVSVLLEATFLNYLRLFSVKPQLMIIGVVLSSLYLPLGWALALALYAGLLMDVFSVCPWGINTFLYPALSFAIISFGRRISLDENSIRAALLFLCVIAVDIAARAISILLGQEVVSAVIFMRIVFLESVYTTVIYFALSKMSKPVFER